MSDKRINLLRPDAETLTMKSPPHEGIAYWRPKIGDGIEDRPLSIFMTQAAYQSINRHTASTLDFEVGGVLIGQVYLSPARSLYIVVEGNLEAKHVHNSPTHLTFTSETLTDMLKRLEILHPTKQIVGWYHTHPGLSIFLSSFDVWLHTHFFPQPWHVALVIDPKVNHGGFFSYLTDEPNYLDAIDYIGFYEMGSLNGNSVVKWLNLEPAEIDFSEKLWKQPEAVKE